MSQNAHTAAGVPRWEDRLPAWGRRAVYLGLCALVSALFVVLYLIAVRAVVNEIRYHATGVAIATAAGLDPRWVQGIHTPEDMGKESFASIQDFIDRIESLNPDVRYIYLMRRSARAGALPSDMEYVVDVTEEDDDGNGVIDPEETSNPPGTPYDASGWPELVNAWVHPTADPQVSPDPPYPDLISGYAPVKDKDRNTVAVVGVDVLARTVRHKILAIRVVMAGVWAVLCVLIMGVYRSYEREKRLVDQLRLALDNVKTLRGLLPICSGCKKIRDDTGYWEQVEIYVSSHSEARFTHSLCPDCLKQMYPEQYEKLKRKGLIRYVIREAK